MSSCPLSTHCGHLGGRLNSSQRGSMMERRRSPGYNGGERAITAAAWLRRASLNVP